MPDARGVAPAGWSARARTDPPALRLASPLAAGISGSRGGPTAAYASARPRILLVDDMPENLRLLHDLLEPLECEITTATNGRDALAQVEAAAPDLILLDVVMPQMNGLAVCGQLKANPATRFIPIVMITGLHGEQEKIRAIEAGADDFLNKPFSRAELLARAKALLRLKRYTDELEYCESALLALGRAVESRDPHTGDHCDRLARMGVRLGEEVALPADSLQALRRGGYLHDIGKVAIPDNVLLKPAKLTEEEWALMRRHTTIGEDICRPLRSFAPVLPIIRSHHERFNGTGYPDGLKGEGIPLLARVMQMVDVYDALRTARPYKQAFTAEAALEQMRREAGQGWLDPALFELFVHTHEGIVADSWPAA